MNKQETNKAIIYEEIGIKSLCARKLKEIISSAGSKQFIGQEILICDKDKAYGIIVLNEPHILDTEQFKNHFSRHFITEEGRENIWPGVSKFNAFSFRIKKIFKEPLQYIYMGKEKLVISKFVKGITMIQNNIDYSDIDKAISIIEYEDKLDVLKNIEVADEDKDLQELFLSLYALFLKRIAEKAVHPVGGGGGRRRCPSGMHRDRRTGRCVRNKNEGN